MRLSPGRQEADEKLPVAPPDRNCAVNRAGHHGHGEGVEAEVENEPQPHNRHCYGGYEEAQSLHCGDEVAAFEEIEEGAGKESEGALRPRRRARGCPRRAWSFSGRGIGTRPEG